MPNSSGAKKFAAPDFMVWRRASKRPTAHHCLSHEVGKVLWMYFSYPQETTPLRRPPASTTFTSSLQCPVHHHVERRNSYCWQWSVHQCDTSVGLATKL